MPEQEKHYPIPDTPLQRQMARGHLNRLGHKLTGYMIEKEPGIMQLVRTCCQQTDNTR